MLFSYYCKQLSCRLILASSGIILGPSFCLETLKYIGVRALAFLNKILEFQLSVLSILQFLFFILSVLVEPEEVLQTKVTMEQNQQL